MKKVAFLAGIAMSIAAMSVSSSALAGEASKKSSGDEVIETIFAIPLFFLDMGPLSEQEYNSAQDKLTKKKKHRKVSKNRRKKY